MEKIQFKAIYGIAIEKSAVQGYVAQQKIIKIINSQKNELVEKYSAKWQDVYDLMIDRVLTMSEDELTELLQSGLNDVFIIKQKLSLIPIRNR